MKGRGTALAAMLLAILAISPAALPRVAAAELTFGEDGCPVADPFASFRFNRYPPQQKSLLKAEFDPADSDEGRPGQEGVDLIVAGVLASLKSGCAPIRLVIVHGGADFDSRGTAFEDHVSVERAFQAMKELKAALDPARAAAVESGDIPDISVSFTFGGIGTRGAVHMNPSGEAQRAENRFVVVRFAHQLAATPTTGADVPEFDESSERPSQAAEPSPESAEEPSESLEEQSE